MVFAGTLDGVQGRFEWDMDCETETSVLQFTAETGDDVSLTLSEYELTTVSYVTGSYAVPFHVTFAALVFVVCSGSGMLLFNPAVGIISGFTALYVSVFLTEKLHRRRLEQDPDAVVQLVFLDRSDVHHPVLFPSPSTHTVRFRQEVTEEVVATAPAEIATAVTDRQFTVLSRGRPLAFL